MMWSENFIDIPNTYWWYFERFKSLFKHVVCNICDCLAYNSQDNLSIAGCIN